MTLSTRGPTRVRLLDAAIGCIEGKGYAATTARDVAGAADANLASIGYHYGSMDALLDEALIAATDRWIGPLLEITTLRDGASIRDRLISGLTAFVASLPEHRNTVIAFFEALARVERSDGLRGRLAEGYDALRANLVELVSEDPAYRELATEAASAVIALHDGVMVQWLLDPHRQFDVASMVDGLTGVLAPRSVRQGEVDGR